MTAAELRTQADVGSARFYERDGAYVIAEDNNGRFYTEGWSNFIGRFATLDEARDAVAAGKAEHAKWTAEYIEAMAKLTPEQKRHAGCDHAYGICSG